MSKEWFTARNPEFTFILARRLETPRLLLTVDKARYARDPTRPPIDLLWVDPQPPKPEAEALLNSALAMIDRLISRLDEVDEVMSQNELLAAAVVFLADEMGVPDGFLREVAEPFLRSHLEGDRRV